MYAGIQYWSLQYVGGTKKASKIEAYPAAVPMLRLPIDNRAECFSSAPPTLGEHTREVLQSIGYAEAEIYTLILARN